MRLAFILVACLFSTAVSAAPQKRTPNPGYNCKLEKKGSFGLITSEFEIDDTGQSLSPYITWDARDGQFANPWITAAFFKPKTGSYALTNGYVSIMRHIWERRPGRSPRPLKLSLELTTNPTLESRLSRIAGEIEHSGGPFHLQVPWTDAAALAKGASKLYVAARDSRLQLFDQVEIDRTIFEQAEPHLLSAFDEVSAMVASPKALCTRSQDLEADDIVVT